MILIEQTNFCNLRCKFCPNRLNQRLKGYMSFEVFKNVIDQIAVSNEFKNLLSERMTLHFFGEPLLNKDFWKNLDYLDKVGFTNVDFSTNGILLDDEVIDRLVKFRCLSWIRISLNSSKRQFMEELNTGSSFDVVVENIGNLLDKIRRSNLVVWVQLMRTEINKDETKEDVVRLIGRDNFIVSEKGLHNYRGQLEKDEIMVEGYYKTVDCSYKFADDLCIQWDGDLVGCCGDDSKLQVYGNIREGIFSEKVRNRRNEFRERLRKKNTEGLRLCKMCIESIR